MAGLVFGLIMFGSIAAVFVSSERRFKRAGYDRRRRPPAVIPAHVFVPDAEFSLRGGVRIRGSNATWPLATLTADDEWVRIKSLVGTVWIERRQTTAVKVVRGLLGPGVVFRSQTRIYDGVIFWTFSSAKTKEVLKARGWPVPD